MRLDDPPDDDVRLRVAQIDTLALASDLDAQGWSVLPDLLTGTQCDGIADMYDKEDGFRSRPVQGTRGDYRVKLRHGVSKIIAGHRHTLGIIFHDAS